MTFRRDFEHRDDLRRAALDEFCERGYDAASINRILSTAGMSKGQLYHHFAGKEGLYLGLVEWMIDEKRRWFSGHPLELPDDFFDALGAQVEASVDFAAEHPDVGRFSRALLAERGRPIFPVVTDRLGFDTTSALGALVRHHHGQGAFRDDLPVEVTERIVLLVVNHLPDLLDIDRPAGLGDDLDGVISFLKRGLAS